MMRRNQAPHNWVWTTSSSSWTSQLWDHHHRHHLHHHHTHCSWCCEPTNNFPSPAVFGLWGTRNCWPGQKYWWPRLPSKRRTRQTAPRTPFRILRRVGHWVWKWKSPDNLQAPKHLRTIKSSWIAFLGRTAASHLQLTSTDTRAPCKRSNPGSKNTFPHSKAPYTFESTVWL